MESDTKAPLCAAIFRLGIVMLQCVRAGEVFCGLHDAHIHIICPVRDVTASDGKLGKGLGTRLEHSHVHGFKLQVTNAECEMKILE